MQNSYVAQSNMIQLSNYSTVGSRIQFGQGVPVAIQAASNAWTTAQRDVTSAQVARVKSQLQISQYFANLINPSFVNAADPATGPHEWNMYTGPLLYATGSPCIAWFDATTLVPTNLTSAASIPITSWAPARTGMACSFKGEARVIPVGPNGLPVVRVLNTQKMTMKVGPAAAETDVNLATGTVIAVTRLMYNANFTISGKSGAAINSASYTTVSKWKPGCVFVMNNSVFSGLGYSIDPPTTATATAMNLYKNSFRTSDTANEGSVNAKPIPTKQTSMNQWDIYSFSVDSTTKNGTLHEGGTFIGTAAYTLPANTNPIRRLAINPGANMANPPVTDTRANSDCEIAEVLVFNRVLSNPERQSIEGYLAWKWGIIDYLPDAHPYADGYPESSSRRQVPACGFSAAAEARAFFTKGVPDSAPIAHRSTV